VRSRSWTRGARGTLKGEAIRACRFRSIVKGEEEVKRLDNNQESPTS